MDGYGFNKVCRWTEVAGRCLSCMCVCICIPLRLSGSSYAFLCSPGFFVCFIVNAILPKQNSEIWIKFKLLPSILIMWEQIHAFRANVKAELTVLTSWVLWLVTNRSRLSPVPFVQTRRLKNTIPVVKKHDIPSLKQFLFPPYEKKWFKRISSSLSNLRAYI